MPDLTDPAVAQLYFDKGYSLATGLLTALFILAAGWLVSKWGQRLTVRSASRLDAAVARFLSNIVRYALLVAAVIAALEAVGIQTTSLVAIFGAAGLAVGLALQGSLSNFASGVMILVFRPFELGDACKLSGEVGKIVDIGLFATTLVNADNHTIILPNSGITGGLIVNFTRLGTRRGTIDIGVAYGTDLRAVDEAVKAAVARCPLALTEPAPDLAFTEMAASSINFKLFVFAEVASFLPMLHQVRSAIYEELYARGIEIPFNQIVVHQAGEAA